MHAPFSHILDRRRIQRSQEQSQACAAPPEPQLGAASQYRERLLHIPVCSSSSLAAATPGRAHAASPAHGAQLLTTPQLPHKRRPLLSLHLRPLVPPQTSFHIPLGPLLRVHADIPAPTIPRADMPTLRLCRVRHVHPAHKEDVPRLASDAESRQAERRAKRRDQGHDQEH
jgi:hypothetical protein